jgi:O-methyltransferase domain/Dimerisation domain
MAAPSETAAHPATPSPAAILRMLAGRWVSGAVAAAARLGVADRLAGGARTSDDLAPELRAHAPSLYRLLRALASLGLLAEDERRRFALTPLGQYLRRDVPGSMFGIAQFFASEEHGATWSTAAYSVASGEPAFEHLYGRTLWEYLDDDSELNGVFCDAMTALSSTIADEVAANLALHGARTVADVGGACGTLLAAVLERNPQTRGILFDRAAVVAAAANRAPAVLRERCDFVAGDFMRSIPAADVLIFARVLHDWSDDDAVRILTKARAALPPHGRVVVIECVIEPGDAPDFGKLLDLEMLVINNGRERTQPEFEALFRRAGLCLISVVPLAAAAILEAVPLP